MQRDEAAACERGFKHLLLSIRSPPGFQLRRVQPQSVAAVRAKQFFQSFKLEGIFRNLLDRIFVFFHGSAQVETCLLKLVCCEDNREWEGCFFFCIFFFYLLRAPIDRKSVFT